MNYTYRLFEIVNDLLKVGDKITLDEYHSQMYSCKVVKVNKILEHDIIISDINNNKKQFFLDLLFSVSYNTDSETIVLLPFFKKYQIYYSFGPDGNDSDIVEAYSPEQAIAIFKKDHTTSCNNTELDCCNEISIVEIQEKFIKNVKL